MSQSEELYACVYAEEFPVQAMLRIRQELREQPCVVMEGDPPLQQVCSANEMAFVLGVEHGMTKVEVDTFPAVTVLVRSHKAEVSTRAALLECAGRFSPRVENCSEDRAFRCVIDIAGTGKLFGPSESLVHNLLDHVRALGIVACVAASANFHAAIALAKGLTRQDPIQVVSAGQECAALAPLPVTVLDLTEEQRETFKLWGISTLGMLAALPEKELIARMGQDGMRLRQLAWGVRQHLFRPIEPAFVLEERMDLDSPVEALDALLFVVNLLLEQLILRATVRVLALASVTATLTLEGGRTHVYTVRPALPTNDRQLWIKLLHLELEAHPPQAAIVAIALCAEPGSTSKVQLGLFSPQLPEPSRLDVTLARIRAIVGEGNVGRAVLKDTHEPDGFRIEPFTISAWRPREASANSIRPGIRWLRPPEPTYVVLQNERPVSLVFRRQRYTVASAYGPWQMSGGWWSSTLWGHEQWDIVARGRDSALLCCCLVHGMLCDEWKMAALYD